MLFFIRYTTSIVGRILLDIPIGCCCACDWLYDNICRMTCNITDITKSYDKEIEKVTVREDCEKKYIFHACRFYKIWDNNIFKRSSS